jgi:hypothetical protein
MGFYGKKLVGSVEMALNRSTPKWLDASFTNIDKLVFYTNSRLAMLAGFRKKITREK